MHWLLSTTTGIGGGGDLAFPSAFAPFTAACGAPDPGAPALPGSVAAATAGAGVATTASVGVGVGVAVTVCTVAVGVGVGVATAVATAIGVATTPAARGSAVATTTGAPAARGCAVAITATPRASAAPSSGLSGGVIYDARGPPAGCARWGSSAPG